MDGGIDSMRKRPIAGVYPSYWSFINDLVTPVPESVWRFLSEKFVEERGARDRGPGVSFRFVGTADHRRVTSCIRVGSVNWKKNI